MINEPLKLNYVKRLQAATIGVLFCFILLFLLFPRLPQMKNASRPYLHRPMEIIFVPQTRQLSRKRPRPMRPVIAIDGEELDILEEVPIVISAESPGSLPALPPGPLSFEELPYMPRQTLEVMPASCSGKVKGEIILLILIDERGRVKKYRVLKNSTNSPKCLAKILAAVKKSRWEVVTLPTGKATYWVKKIYRLNGTK